MRKNAIGPPSSGGVALLQLLNVLEGYPLGEYGHNSSRAMHLMAEAERRVYADRSGPVLAGLLAAAGLLNPLLAAFIHVTSELAFILNSARLLPAASATARRTAHVAATTIAPIA